MALPLPVLTFYRMPVQTVGAATPAGTIAAIYAGASSATDYRGTALPSSHLWTWATSAGEEVHATPPAGTPMTFVPGICWAAGAVVGSSVFLAPDNGGAFVAGQPIVSICKSPGAFTTWGGNANPWTATGLMSNWWRWAPIGVNAVTTTSIVYISQEVIIVTLNQSATANHVSMAGAILEPYTDSSGTTCETDSRLYGMAGTGVNTGLPAAMLSSLGDTLMDHSTANNNGHAMVFQPGAAAVYAVGRDSILSSAAATIATQQDAANAFVGRAYSFCRNQANLQDNGIAMGRLREFYWLGLAQSGMTRRNGATDLFHTIGRDNSVTTAVCYCIKAAA